MEKRKWLLYLSVLFLLIPLILFVYGWIREPISIFLLVVLFMFFVAVLRDLYISILEVRYEYVISKHKADPRANIFMWGIALVVILVWLLLSGIGGFGYQNTDYLASNALLKDLIDQPWPLTLQWDGVSAPIVYYVGWYLPAALVGKMFGWSAGNIFSLIWSFIGVSLSFGWFLKACAIKKLTAVKMFVTLIVFCMADGLDLIMIHSGGWGGLEYSAQTTLMYWVPQHAVSAWLITGLVVDYIYGHLSTVKYLGISLAGCVISSPFGVVGILPYLFVTLVVNWKQYKNIFSLQSVIFNLIAIPFGLAGLLYLSSNKFSFPAGFLWEFSDSSLVFVGWIAFCLIEFGILSGFVFAGMWLDGSTYLKELRSINKFKGYLKKIHGMTGNQYILFVFSVITLFLLPSYKMGYNDDFVMRASVPSLFIFWSFISKILVDSGFNRNSEIRFLHRVIGCLVVIGFYVSSVQIFRSIAHYHFGSPDRNSVLTTTTANPPWIVEQRIGNGESFFYRYLGR